MKAKANRPAKPATKATDPAETMSPKLKEILSRATTTARIDKLLAQINAANTEQDTNETNLQMREEQTVFMPSLIDQTLLLQQQVQKILAQEAKTREIFDPYQQKFEDFSSICTETQERISDIEKANPDFSQQTEATLAKAEALAPKPSEEELADASAQALEGLKGVEYPSKPLRRNKPIKPPKGIVPTARNINTDPALREYAGSIDLGQNWLKEMSDD